MSAPFYIREDFKQWRYAVKSRLVYFTLIRGHEFENEYFKLDKFGKITVFPGYRWDGPSTPFYIIFDLDSIIRASLFHDIIYQLLREGFFSDSKAMRLTGDNLFWDICIEDARDRWLANIEYYFIRKFGKKHTIKKIWQDKRVDKIF